MALPLLCDEAAKEISMLARVLLTSAISAAFALLSRAQTYPPAGGTAPTTQGVSQLRLRSLPAVLDARERRRDWHEAAQQAASRIADQGLRSQFNQRLSGLVP